MKQLYTVRIAKNDSIANVEYQHALYVWWQRGVLTIQFGERGIDRSYIYYPKENVDHVHVIEEPSDG